jgi:hypothetical protein
MAEPQTGMPKAEMRRLLNLAKKEPVSFAIGLGPDPKFGLLMLDKQKQPKAVEKLLMTAIPDTKSTRWGSATVNADDDAKLVRMIVNRPVNGMARKLVKTLKGTGFNKVLLALEDGTEVETYGEEDEEEGAPATANAAPQADAAPPAPPTAPPLEATSPPPPPPPPVIDRSALERRLGELIRRIPQSGADANTMHELGQLATVANGALKAEQLNDAARAIGQLQAKLNAIPPPPGAASGPTDSGAAVRVAKGLLVWNSTRTYVGQQIKKLEQAIIAQSVGEPDFDEIKANLGELDVVLEKLDDQLSNKLDELRGAQPEAKAALSEAARTVVTDYQAFIANDPLMQDIDDNGFIPLDINAKVTAALDAVLKTI